MKEMTKRDRSRNALVHGIYSRDLLLPWDSKDEFEKLHYDLQAEFSPRGRAEDEAVLDLAVLHWQKRRTPNRRSTLPTRRKAWKRWFVWKLHLH